MKSFRRWLVENKDWSDLDLKQYSNSGSDVSDMNMGFNDNKDTDYFDLPKNQNSDLGHVGIKREIDEIADDLQFKPTTKKKIIYKFVPSYEELIKPDHENSKTPKYTQIKTPIGNVVTITADGHKETENKAAVPGDIVISGTSGERYVLKLSNFSKKYEGKIGGDIVPEQSKRMVACYEGPVARQNGTIYFDASWGEKMILTPGDYLVKDGENYYRIGKTEFEATYNPI